MMKNNLLLFLHIPFVAAMTGALHSEAQSPQKNYSSSSISAPIQFVQVDTLRIAYKEIGKGEPIIFLQRFRGTLSDWDPAFVDGVAKKYRVLLFDAAGAGLSSGNVPTSITTMANQAVAFSLALGIRKAHYLGWSMGGAIAQAVAIDHPQNVDKLILAATGPSANPELAPGNPEFGIRARKPVYEFEDNQFLFFYSSDTSKAACSEYLARLASIKEKDSTVSLNAYTNMSIALASFKSNKEKNYFEQLKSIAIPVLIANGKFDPSYPFINSYVLCREIIDSKLIIYPDAGHGFLFQCNREFVQEVLSFLSKADNK